MTEQFNLGALERALTTKERKPKLKLKPYSREELLSQVKRMAEELDKLSMRNLSTRYDDSSWKYVGRFYQDGYRKEDDEAPLQVLERLVVNGQKRLKPYHDMINHIVMTNPELALEANLEGRTGFEVLSYAYNQRIEQIDEYLRSHIVISPPHGPAIFIKFGIELGMGGETLGLSINGWLHHPGISIDGVSPYPKKKKEMDGLIFFIQNTDKVIAEIGRQISQIEIKKEVTNEG